MRRVLAGAVALLLMAAPVAAGCGGGDDSSAGTLTKEDYTAQVSDALGPIVDALRKLARSADDIAESPVEASSLEQLGQDLGEAEAVYEQTTTTLGSLEPPEEVADLHERLVAAHEEITQATTSAREAAERGDEQALQAFQGAGEKYQQELSTLSEEFSAKGYEFEPPQP